MMIRKCQFYWWRKLEYVEETYVIQCSPQNEVTPVARQEFGGGGGPKAPSGIRTPRTHATSYLIPILGGT